MDENKDQKIQNPETVQPAAKEESTIDFSKFSLGSEKIEQSPEKSVFQQSNGFQTNQAQPGIAVQPVQEQAETRNLIAELNSMQEEKKQDINIENIVIQEDNETKEKSEMLGNSLPEKKVEINKSNKKIETVMASYIAIGFSILIIIITGIYGKYISLSVDNKDTVTSTNQTILDKTKTITETISEYTKINDYALRANRTDVLTSDNSEKIAKELIQSDKLNYLHKKDILEKNMEILKNETIQNAQKLDNIKKDIIKYGFIPQQLYHTIDNKGGIVGITKRIALMENIRLITAFKAFSYMESFVQGLTNSLGKDPLIIESKLKKAIADGENDIIIYTNTCFLNPYEINSSCTTIEDFDNYYKIIDTQRDVDTEFIKQLATYIDNKLQETDIPTFSINFYKFNPKEEKIDFIIDINTNSQDEIALNKQGVLNPHVFIVSNIINLLKQSLLIIGEDIKTDQIKTSPKTIRLGSTIFTVNNSSIKLSLPIQKSIQREISDFFSSKY